MLIAAEASQDGKIVRSHTIAMDSVQLRHRYYVWPKST